MVPLQSAPTTRVVRFPPMGTPWRVATWSAETRKGTVSSDACGSLPFASDLELAVGDLVEVSLLRVGVELTVQAVLPERPRFRPPRSVEAPPLTLAAARATEALLSALDGTMDQRLLLDDEVYIEGSNDLFGSAPSWRLPCVDTTWVSMAPTWPTRELRLATPEERGHVAGLTEIDEGNIVLTVVTHERRFQFLVCREVRRA